MGRALAVAVVALMLGVFPASARAQPDLRQQARRHFDQGVALFETGDLQAALGEFEEAQRLHAHPRILRNIAATQEALLRYLDAIATMEQYIADPLTSPGDRRDGELHLRELRALLARVEVVVDAPQAEVWVDGRQVGASPLATPVAVASGTHVIEIRKRGFQSESRTIGVSAGTISRQEFHLAVQPARLRLESNAPGGRVQVDGGVEHAAPAELALAPGVHVVTARAPAFVPARERITLAPGEVRALTMVLERPAGEMTVALRPSRARLFVDGVLRPLPADRRLRIEAGLHRLRVDAPGRVPWEDDVQFVADRDQSLSVSLGRDRAHVRPAFFVASAVVTGALVAAAVVATLRAFLLAADYRDPSDDRDADMRQLADDSRGANLLADVLWGGAAVGAIGSGILFLYSQGEPPEPEVTLSDR